MSEVSKDDPEKETARSAKRPYTKPKIASEPIYETLALACGKLPGQGAACNAVPRRS